MLKICDTMSPVISRIISCCFSASKPYKMHIVSALSMAVATSTWAAFAFFSGRNANTLTCYSAETLETLQWKYAQVR